MFETTVIKSMEVKLFCSCLIVLCVSNDQTVMSLSFLGLHSNLLSQHASFFGILCNIAQAEEGTIAYVQLLLSPPLLTMPWSVNTNLFGTHPVCFSLMVLQDVVLKGVISSVIIITLFNWLSL